MEEFNELMTKLEKAALAGEFAKVRDILKDEGKEHALWQPVGLPSMHPQSRALDGIELV
jgi:hypothetical protein